MQKILIGAALVIVLVGVSAFYAGQSYAKSASATVRGQFAGAGQFGGRSTMRNGGFASGQILTSSASSITIRLPNGSTQIILLGSSTPVFKSTQGTASDLAEGTTVVVNGSDNSDGSLTAQSIQIRPATQRSAAR